MQGKTKLFGDQFLDSLLGYSKSMVLYIEYEISLNIVIFNLYIKVP